MIVASGALLQAVVDDVLDYSKLEAGAVEIDIERTNLQDTLNAVVRSIESKAIERKLSLRAHYDASLVEFVNTDGRRLQQILFNLLGNAIKFSREGGVVDFGAFLLPLPGGSKEYNLRLFVKDYGKGIAKGNYDKIFQPFTQETHESERLYGGTGLGLAIVAKLVECLGGTIEIDSRLGEWSKFTVDLPVDNAPADIARISGRLNSAFICFLCNQRETVDQVTRIFRQYRADITVYSDAREIVADINSHRIPRDRTVICLADEELYDQESYCMLSRHCSISSSCSSRNPVLLTFGPMYGVQETLAHYRSLDQIFPSVLIKEMGDFAQSAVIGVPPSICHHRVDSVKSVQSEATEYHGTVAFKELKILIAEDNLVNQKVLRRMLTRLGVEDIETVENGALAVERESARQFDLILMDLEMPVMNGTEACRQIMTRRSRCSGSGGGQQQSYPQIIFVTAHVAESFKAECAEAGGVGYIAKPCNMNAVRQKIEEVLSLSSPSS